MPDSIDHRQSKIENCFAWLSAPGLSALCVLHLRGGEAFLRQRGWRGGDGPSHAWLKNARGEPLDEVMVAREEGGFTVTCHGGPAVRAAVEAELRQAGFTACNAGELPLCGAATLYKREMLRLLPLAQSDKGVEFCLWALEHGEAALARALERPEELVDLVWCSEPMRYFFDPMRVHLWGPVNAGKSSLLNALCGEQLAAVGDEPGLTRDVIEGRFEHDGFTIRVFDTPGEMAGGGALEELAFAQAREQRGDCVLHLVAPGGALPAERGALVVHSRADETARGPGAFGHATPGFPCAVSVKWPQSLENLKAALVELQAPGVCPAQGNAFAISAPLRTDLNALVDGQVGADELRRKWL